MTDTCSYTFDPTTHEGTTVSTDWSCPHDAHGESDYCPFHLGPSEYDTHDLTATAVTDALVDTIKNDDTDETEFIGAELRSLELDFRDLESEDQHPIDLRHATIERGITARHSRFEERLDLRHAVLGQLDLNNATLEEGILCSDSVLAGPVNFFEGLTTGGNTDFTGSVFEADVTFDEADFNTDVSFEQARFQGEATFEGADFYGTANSIGDNTTFDDAVFEAATSFFQARFEYASLERATFHDDALFEKATATGSILFTDVVFEAVADFDEVTFQEDVSFRGARFDETATFRGIESHGGAAILDDDLTFEDAVFADRVTFEKGAFRYANFTAVQFGGDAIFQRVTAADDCTFENAVFSGVADFDEMIFDGDADFSSVRFDSDATFRGAEFYGGTNHLADDAIFRHVTFGGDANFSNSLFTSADFVDTAFSGQVNFVGAEFTDAFHLRASSTEEPTSVNCTDATIADGEIIQPREGWVRVDVTRAVLGPVTLSATANADERELLDYFRFCDTTFDGFDFSSHTSYLDRNDWNLHDFERSADYESAVEMTPETIEKTYLKAKNNASNQSNIKAAGEFRVKRQQFARRKFFDITTDTSESLGTRVQNLLRGVENWFLGVSCGYGLRLYRIAAVFLVLPFFAGLLFAFGGPAFETGAGQLSSIGMLGTADGLYTLALNIYFSYITFLTVGYGNIGPTGLGARGMAAVLVYLNVILAGLFLYALIKRSEI